ncbi:translation initiation factor IF-2 N-terminal domain-containing protein [Aliarcobacter cryaerophilus]|uniref:translation initiation factor IF-2 N-terminal domain-containing protein n=1 Tax=Aliarcobacter cryaerophilus TaxID=28198 RepID=UPI000EAE8065|nr:translation initiation factor IF-2 N-terminal domain-containing protein [Aliarcobacter cryaerophilus]AYJ78556.1 ATP-binding protein (AAA domain) [Aliarcobacter cryaerophilus D2610]
MSDKVRVFEIAEEVAKTSVEVMQKAKELGIDLKTAQASVSYEDAEEITQYILTGKSDRLGNEKYFNFNSELNSDIKDIKIIIENLKQIKYLEFEVKLEKGIYSIIGNNGVGKSSLVTCLGKLVEPNCLRGEFKGNNSYIDSTITYRINGKIEIEWKKPKNWVVSSNNNYMPKLNGVFEASLITGHRFNHMENKNKAIHTNQLKYSYRVDEFVIQNLDYILNGKETYKYKELQYLSNKNTKELYFIKYGNDYITEFYFSAGEYFLLSILKFINLFKNRKNKENLGMIVIDEIEISLHPLAQKRLIEKLKEFKDEYNLLIIFATHSLQIIEELEPKDIYYFENNNGECIITNPIYKGYLASRLYQHVHYDKIILVEDDLAKKFIVKLLKNEEISNLLYSIIPIGGWEKVLEIYRINENDKIYSNAKVIAIFDGDVEVEVNKSKNNDIKKYFLPIENIEKYTVTNLFHDIEFRKKLERNFLAYKKLEDLPINIKVSKTEEIKQTFKKGIIGEVSKASGKNTYDYQIEDFILDEIINKLKKEDLDKFEKFKKNIFDFFK